ncbi:hypothetical protein EV122DRAFT_249503 [Schizophyllum commune]
MSYHPILRPGASAPSRRRSHEQDSHPFFNPAFASSDEPYRNKRSELSSQLYDPTSTFSGIDYNHSTRAIDHMVRLGTTAQNYGQENHVKRNLGDWVEVFNRLGSAEQKTRQLLGDLQTLTLPRPLGSGGGAYPVAPMDVSTTEGPSHFAGGTNRFGVEQYAAISVTNTSYPDGSTGGYVARREAMDGEYQVAGSARRAKQAQFIDGLLDTSSFTSAGGKHRSKDDHVYALCVEVENLAKSGIRRLHTLDSNFYKADGAWASVVSNISQSTGTLYHAVSTTAAILGGIVNGIDNDPTGTKATADKARAAAEDLRHNAHMILMAYIELAAIVQKILTTRRHGRLLPDATKEHIAQFFWSFGRHFDTLPGDSIQHIAQVQYNGFQSSRTSTRTGITSNVNGEESGQQEGLPIYTQDGRAAGSATDSSVEVLSSAEPEALASIAYPPVIHFFLVQVIGSQWNDRLYALAKLSPFFHRIQADIRHIGSLTVQLQLSIEGMQERFSVTKMLDYRELIPERQWQVDQFLARTLGELEPWIDYIRSSEKLIRRFDAPALEKYIQAHVRLQ